MKFHIFPKSKLTLQTSLSKNEALKRLEIYINEEKMVEQYFNADGTPMNRFIGKIEQPSFKIYQRLEYEKNSFRPIIRGIVKEDEKGSLIEVKMALPGCIIAFILIWCYLPIFIIVNSILLFFVHGTFEWQLSLIMLIPLVFMYTLMRLAFRSGKRAAVNYLQEIFKGELIEQDNKI
ncbi:MAG: hypothetical protein SFU99_03625 [Saprospiraceae bacterium]|nr:hypothetical protein [Saprospiraceae bacterium]